MSLAVLLTSSPYHNIPNTWLRYITVVFLLTLTTVWCRGQTVEEIIETTIEKTGGASGWARLQGFKINAKFDQGGVEFPLEIAHLKDGRKYTRLNFQGTEIMQGVFDGTTLWSTDFQTQQPQKSDAETTANVALDTNDFPDALFNYQQKEYLVQLVEKLNFEGQPAFKIKLTREPITLDGNTIQDVIFYYIHQQTFLPIAREFELKQGPIKESTMVIRLDDFREVNGLMFPFSMSQGVKDVPPQPIKVESIVLNPKIGSDQFRFPGE
jgi:hypothetical protein